MSRSVAVLCSGGDAPGMNAALRAIVRSGIYHGLNVYGVYKGYSGLLEGNLQLMNARSVANIIQRGGTILKTDRCKAFFQKSARAEAVHLLHRKKIDALIVIGGEGSFTGAYLMANENNYPVVGVPGTIDNDVFGSEYTIGFDTAVNTALDAIDKIRDTASAHDRVFLVEVMGRTSGEIATHVGVSGGAEIITVPNHSLSDSLGYIIKKLRVSSKQEKLSSIVVCAEGEHPGSTYELAKGLREQAGIDSRVAILGHVQRGGSPSAKDRLMASIMGACAIESVIKNKFKIVVGVVRGQVTTIPMQKIIGKHKKPDQKLLALAEILSI